MPRAFAEVSSREERKKRRKREKTYTFSPPRGRTNGKRYATPVHSSPQSAPVCHNTQRACCASSAAMTRAVCRYAQYSCTLLWSAYRTTVAAHSIPVAASPLPLGTATEHTCARTTRTRLQFRVLFCCFFFSALLFFLSRLPLSSFSPLPYPPRSVSLSLFAHAHPRRLAIFPCAAAAAAISSPTRILGSRIHYIIVHYRRSCCCRRCRTETRIRFFSPDKFSLVSPRHGENILL